MSHTSSQKIGPYWQGEIPEPFEFQFLDADGSPVSLLGGFSAKATIEKSDGTEVTANAVVSDGAAGTVRYDWGSTDTNTSGATVLQFWAGNGTVRYASPLFLFQVVAARVTAPAV